MVRAGLAALRRHVDGSGGEPAVVICGASAALIIGHYQGNTGFYRTLLGDRFDNKPWSGAVGHFWWFGFSVLVYLLLPLLLSVVSRGSFFRRYGLGLGDWRAGLAITALLLTVMLPATWYASTLPSFKGIYPLGGPASWNLTKDGVSTPSWRLFLLYECGYFFYFVGWEFLFRGWMLNGLLPKWGKAPAILVQVAPFAVMHLGKAELEALGSIVAGVALGVLALRTRSFWYGALLHGLVAVWMDLLATKGQLWGVP
jgi:uncharacterized protein